MWVSDLMPGKKRINLETEPAPIDNAQRKRLQKFNNVQYRFLVLGLQLIMQQGFVIIKALLSFIDSIIGKVTHRPDPQAPPKQHLHYRLHFDTAVTNDNTILAEPVHMNQPSMMLIYSAVLWIMVALLSILFVKEVNKKTVVVVALLSMGLSLLVMITQRNQMQIYASFQVGVAWISCIFLAFSRSPSIRRYIYSPGKLIWAVMLMKWAETLPIAGVHFLVIFLAALALVLESYRGLDTFVRKILMIQWKISAVLIVFAEGWAIYKYLTIPVANVQNVQNAQIVQNVQNVQNVHTVLEMCIVLQFFDAITWIFQSALQ